VGGVGWLLPQRRERGGPPPCGGAGGWVGVKKMMAGLEKVKREMTELVKKRKAGMVPAKKVGVE
jgi:hypothetical protein